MSETNGYSSSDAGPVEAALADYFSRLDRGEPIDVTEIIARNPGCEAGLRQFLRQERNLHQAVATAASSITPHDELAGRIVGDFRLKRVIGRGGMGVVYEAEQVSLGRRVALKVLPFAAMLDKQHLARFKNEARAAATLDHENIVAVYSVGSDGDLHYYAMQLIAGQSLAQVIAAMRAKSVANRSSVAVAADSTVTDHRPRTTDFEPAAEIAALPEFNSHEYFSTIVRLGIQAAEALDHAHQNGVLHRDIKPANLLLDGAGKLWVTDFGLARIEHEAGMTMTGDIVGTLRYMSPEQALAIRAVVDHRSDIYSLGVTFYELITLQPAIRGDDRQEILRQIAFDDPRKPRQINERLPRDLETIVLKAIEKEPSDRYDSAQELAGDLRRFLANEPIRAKPARALERLTKWSRRHVAAVWATLAASLLVTLVLLVSTALVVKWYREASMQRMKAERESELASIARTISAKDRSEAIKEATRAQAVTNFLVNSLQAHDPYRGGKQDITVADAMTRAIKQLDDGYLADHPATVAYVLEQVAMILHGNGRTAEAELLAARSVEILRQLSSDDEAAAARALNNLAGMRMSMGKLKEAEPLFEELLKVYGRLYAGKDHEHLAWAMNNLAGVRDMLGRAAEAEPLFQQALEMERRRLAGKDDPSLVRAMLNLGGVQLKLDRAAEALEMYEQAMAMSQRLYPGDHPLVAHSLTALGGFHMTRDDVEKAEPLWEQALQMRQRLFKGDHQDVAVSLNNLAGVRQERGQLEEAESLYQEALEMFQRLFPGDHPHIVRCLANVALARKELGRHEEAESLLVDAVEMANRVLPRDHEYRRKAIQELQALRRSRSEKVAHKPGGDG
ncbi:MAG TPA: serine/threonine-protein kinase [Lacipirellulaceae bacterium]|nr:serine/threonine-protein kinase [Lacipirellulaceae bacterium]